MDGKRRWRRCRYGNCRYGRGRVGNRCWCCVHLGGGRSRWGTRLKVGWRRTGRGLRDGSRHVWQVGGQGGGRCICDRPERDHAADLLFVIKIVDGSGQVMFVKHASTGKCGGGQHHQAHQFLHGPGSAECGQTLYQKYLKTISDRSIDRKVWRKRLWWLGIPLLNTNSQIRTRLIT